MTTEKMPTVVLVEPEITESNLSFKWNFEKVKNSLEAFTEKYKGLVVTDDNLKDMEKARREVVHIRTALSKFRADGRRKLKEPSDRFSKQCDELIAVVTDVEMPINQQLEVYEEKRREELKERITSEYRAKASNMGLDIRFWQLDMPERWFNRTQKWSETCNDVDRLIKDQLVHQKEVEGLEELNKAKKDLMNSTIEAMNIKYELKTPLTPVAVFGSQSNVFDYSLTDIKEMIESKAKAQKEMEDRAVQMAKEKAAEKKEEPVHDEQPVCPPPEEEEPVQEPPEDISLSDEDITVNLHFTFKDEDKDKIRVMLCGFMNWLKDNGAKNVTVTREE